MCLVSLEDGVQIIIEMWCALEDLSSSVMLLKEMQMPCTSLSWSSCIYFVEALSHVIIRPRSGRSRMMQIQFEEGRSLHLTQHAIIWEHPSSLLLLPLICALHKEPIEAQTSRPRLTWRSWAVGNAISRIPGVGACSLRDS